MINSWIGMRADTKQARHKKAKEIRLCRHYLAEAKKQGLSEKSTTIRYWRMTLAAWRAEPMRVVRSRLWRNDPSKINVDIIPIFLYTYQ